MRKNAYSLGLAPKSFVMVRDDLAYEIGLCSGDYNGHYVLVWEKQPAGGWLVRMDSNY